MNFGFLLGYSFSIKARRIFREGKIAPPFETRKIRLFEGERIFREIKKMLQELWRRQIAGLPEDGTIPNYGDFTLIKKEDVNEDIDGKIVRTAVFM